MCNPPPLCSLRQVAGFPPERLEPFLSRYDTWAAEMKARREKKAAARVAAGEPEEDEEAAEEFVDRGGGFRHGGQKRWGRGGGKGGRQGRGGGRGWGGQKRKPNR